MPAHGVGGQENLPLPGEMVLQAGGFVVLASFLAVALLWRRPVFQAPVVGRPLPGVVQRLADGRRVRSAVRTLVLLLLGYVVVVAFAGPAEPAANPASRALYVLLWVGLVPASLLFGPVWRVLNPLRALHRFLAAAVRVPVGGVRRLPVAVGYWPAAVGLTAFVWLELVPENRAEPEVVGAFLVGYSLLTIAPAMVFGSDWFDRADPFEAYSSLIAALAPVGRRADRTVVLRNPLRGLAEVRAAPGLVAVLAVWWGSTVFDGLSGWSRWPVVSTPLATAALAGLVALVGLAYRVAAGASAAALAGTLIPIAVGYTMAHYASLLVTEGPVGVLQLAAALGPISPFGSGAVPHAVALPAPVLIAALQVSVVLVGHVVGVLAAHDRGAAVLPEHRRLADQIPLVLLMVVYTMVGLYLLVVA